MNFNVNKPTRIIYTPDKQLADNTTTFGSVAVLVTLDNDTSFICSEAGWSKLSKEKYGDLASRWLAHKLGVGSGAFDFTYNANTLSISNLYKDPTTQPTIHGGVYNTIGHTLTGTTTQASIKYAFNQDNNDTTFVGKLDDSAGTYKEVIYSFQFPRDLLWYTDTTTNTKTTHRVKEIYILYGSSPERSSTGGYISTDAGITSHDWVESNPGSGYGGSSSMGLQPSYYGTMTGSESSTSSGGIAHHDLVYKAPTINTAFWDTKVFQRITDVRSSETERKASTFETIAFKYTSSKNEKLPDFTWKVKSAKHIFNYWEQIGYYGYSANTQGNIPTNYVMLSEINNETYVPTSKLIDVFTKDNAPITKTIAWKDNLVIFTPNTTSLAVGRVPTTKQLVHSDIGVSDFYRNTVQIISDSIVFKNKDSVFAFVPTPGTDGATSLRVRDVAEQIKPYLAKIEADNNNKFKISSIGYNSKEYWLIYTLKDSTVIFRYDWSKFAWFINEYPVPLFNFIKISDQTIIAADKYGNIYNPLSPYAKQYHEAVAKTFYGRRETVFNQHLVPNNPELFLPLQTAWKKYLNAYPTGTLADIDGYWQDAVLEPIKDHQFKINDLYFTMTDFPTLVQIPYSFELGSRRPTLDVDIITDDVTVMVGNDGETPVLNQTLSIYTDGFELMQHKIDIDSSTSAITESSPQIPWGFDVSMYDVPSATKHTKKIRKSVSTIDIHLDGVTPNKLFLDGIQFRYRQSGRKSR